MLTIEGKEAARECLRRSGMEDCQENSVTIECSDIDKQNTLDMEHSDNDLETEVISPPTLKKKQMNVPLDSLERVYYFGFQLKLFLISEPLICRSLIFIFTSYIALCNHEQHVLILVPSLLNNAELFHYPDLHGI